MNPASECNRGPMALTTCLTMAINDFVAHFGKSPGTLTIPCWRYDELIRSFMLIDDPTITGDGQSFCGIPLRFSPHCDLIELA